MLWFLKNKAITYLIQVLNKPLAFRVPKEAKKACMLLKSKILKAHAFKIEDFNSEALDQGLLKSKILNALFCF